MYTYTLWREEKMAIMHYFTENIQAVVSIVCGDSMNIFYVWTLSYIEGLKRYIIQVRQKNDATQLLNRGSERFLVFAKFENDSWNVNFLF